MADRITPEVKDYLGQLKDLLIKDWCKPNDSAGHNDDQVLCENILCILLGDRQYDNGKLFNLKRKVELLALCKHDVFKLGVLFSYFENDVIASFVKKYHKESADELWFTGSVSKFEANLRMAQGSADSPATEECFWKQSDEIIAGTVRRATLPGRVNSMQICLNRA